MFLHDALHYTFFRKPGALEIPKVPMPWLGSNAALLARLAEGFRRHGDVLQLSRTPLRVFCFRHPEHIKQIYTHETVGTSKLPRLLPRVQWIMGKGSFIHPGGDDWKRRRRPLQFGLTRAASRQLAGRVLEAARPALERMGRLATQGKPIDIHHEMGRLTVDVTLQCLFSEEAGDRLEHIHRQTQFVLDKFTSRGPIRFPSLQNYRFRAAARDLQRFMSWLIEKRLRSSERPADLLTLMTAPDKQTGERWPIQDVQDEMFSLYFGASIMKIALAWTLYLLSTHPHVCARLHAEAREVLGGQVPTPEDLERLPYVEMVFQESLRLYPPVWAIPRYAGDEVQLAGYRFPARSLLLPIGYFAHRHPDFWNDPEVFDPERFAPDQVGKIHPFAHYPFGGGPRMCLGRNLAPIICKLILVMLAQRFSFTFAPRVPGEPKLDFNFELAPKGRLWLVLREKSVNW